MKRAELILVIIWVAFLLLKGVGYVGGTALFGLATVVLSLYYLFVSFKLFKPENNSLLIIPILAGLSLATSLITIPFTVSVRNLEWLQILSFINIIFTAFLLVLVFYRLIRKIQIENSFKRILFRTSLVLLITSLFAFRPIENKIYRNIVSFLNAGNDNIIHNMAMIDYWQQSEEQLEIGNCEDAIDYALHSFKEGLKWLRIDGDVFSENDLKKLWNIQATYTNVYRAYDCKAEALIDVKSTNEALYYLLKADSFLNISPIAKGDWSRKLRADSKNNIGVCYQDLYMHDSATHYFTKAIEYHIDSIGTLNVNLSTYLNNVSTSLSVNRYWNESSQMAIQSILVLDKDSVSEDKSGNYASAYLQLIYNSLAESKLSEAKEYLSEVEQYLNPEIECKYYLYKSLIASRLDNPTQMLIDARYAKDCFIEQFGERYQNVAESYALLFQAWISIPNYDSALLSIERGIEITKSNHGDQSVRYFDYIKREAFYYYYVGLYDESLSRLLNVKEIYERDLGRDSDKLTEVLSLISQIKIEEDAYHEARKYASESLRLLELNDLFSNSSASNLLNNLAYVSYVTNQYSVADTLYKKSIELNIEAGNDSSLSVASALNGLGLLATRKKKFSEADLLFKQSLQFYRNLIPDLHPDIGMVLMNQSNLALKRQKLSLALELIEDAYENFAPFHRVDHPTIGDIYSLKATILSLTGEIIEAEELFTKTLEIYESNYQLDHSKIRNTKELLRVIDTI